MADLDRVDLSLLRSLDALVAEGHVTRAAKRLGLTQSAMSHRLRQLREVFGDPLLVPSPTGLVATPRAEALIGPVRAALRQLDAALRANEPFDPATAERTFTLAMPDYTMATAVPRFFGRLAAEGPQLSFVLEDVGADLVERLAAGTLDVAFTARPHEGAGLRRRRIWREGFVVLARPDHPSLGAAETVELDVYCSLHHLLVAPGGRPGGVVDAALERLGRRRHVALRLTNFVAAPYLVARSDLVATVPVGLAAAMAAPLGLRVLEPPLALGAVDGHLFWHERAEHDPGHRWLRETILACVAEIADELARGLGADASPPT